MKEIKVAHHFYFHDKTILTKRYSSSQSQASVSKNPTFSIKCISKSLQKKAITVNGCVKILCEPYKGYYAIAISQSYGEKWEMQYLKKLFDKYILKVGDFDSRELDKLNMVDPIVDKRGQ